MKAEIIAVGTEILTGQIVNTNSRYLSEKMAELGIDVYYHTAVGDNAKRLSEVLDVASRRSDFIILCGGLGPTDDDLTKPTLATFLNRELVIDKAAMSKIDRFFDSRPSRIRTPNNERQAYILQDSLPVSNPTGLAVGNLVEQGGVTYIVLPGPPSELTAMFTQSLQPLLEVYHTRLYSRVLRFFGIGESQLVTILADVIEKQTDPTIAPYAKTGEVTLRLSTKSNCEAEAMEKLDKLEAEILSRGQLADFLYGYGEENSLAYILAEEMKKAALSIAILENHTAGGVQASLTAGLQDVFFYRGGRIVHPEMVSEQVACEAAQKIRQEQQADLGLAVLVDFHEDTSVELAKLTLYLALAGDKGCYAKQVQLGGFALQNMRTIVSLHAFDYVRNSMKNYQNLL